MSVAEQELLTIAEALQYPKLVRLKEWAKTANDDVVSGIIRTTISEPFTILFFPGKCLQMGGLCLITEAAIPAFRQNKAIADRVVVDLESMGLVSGAGLNVTLSGSGLLAQRTTPLGRVFLQFVADPEDL